MNAKGEINGICNMSSCNSGDKATWYNYGSRAYYCKSCAIRLNIDPYNKRDADRLFGHDLCMDHSELSETIAPNLFEPSLNEQQFRETMCEIDTLILNCKRLRDSEQLGSTDRTIACSRIVAYIECKRILMDKVR